MLDNALYVVDGVWSPWSAWSNCSVTCGTGIRIRTRQCNGPLHGGSPCDGEANKVENCDMQPCLGKYAAIQRSVKYRRT